MAQDIDDEETGDLSQFDPKAYAKAVQNLKIESDGAKEKAQTASTTAKGIQEKHGIPAAITNWAIKMLTKTEEQRLPTSRPDAWSPKRSASACASKATC